jgi:zinc protease
MRRSLALLALSAFFAAAHPAAQGQEKPDLPTADTVMNQYIEATGGKAAYEKMKNSVATGTIEIPAANIKGKLKLTQAAPNKLAMYAELGPAGVNKRVTDGKTVWDYSTIAGERVLDGEEKDSFLVDADFYKELHWKELYAKVECVGVEDVNDKPAYKIVLTPKSGKPTTEYYDKVSHLRVKSTQSITTPMGDVQIEEYQSDYKEVDGVKTPFTITQKVLTQEIVMKLTDIKTNVELPEDTFKKPTADEPEKKKAD